MEHCDYMLLVCVPVCVCVYLIEYLPKNTQKTDATGCLGKE